MKKQYIAVLALGLILGAVSSALASPFSNAVANDLYNGNTPNIIPTPQFTPGLGYDLFNAVNYLYKNNNLTKNEGLDTKLLAQDSTWEMTQGFGSLYVIGRTAMNVNDLGFYVLMNGVPVKSSILLHAPSGFTWYGDGTQANPFPGIDFATFSGNNFGWYITSTDWNTGIPTTFYSDPQFNSDRYDHMVTYSLSGLAGKSIWIEPDYGIPYVHEFTANAYLIGLEDRKFGYYGTPTLGDDDYNDLLILVDATQMNPVPEPTTLALVGVGLAGLWVAGRRSRR
jgi:hypothetical protein